MTARPHLHLVSEGSGEVIQEDVCPNCVELAKEVAKKAREITRLKNAEAERLGLAADAKTIRDVLEHHKRLFPGTKIITGKKAWKAVKARLADVDENGKPAFSPLALKAAAMGLKMGRAGEFADRPHGAAWLYEDEERVQYWLERCVTFKRETGVSALHILDVLGRGGFEALAVPCGCCGHLRLEHERENPLEELFDPPCAVHGCACPGFEPDRLWEMARWVAERERDVA